MQFKPRRTEGASGNGRLTASAASRAPGVAGVLQTFGKPEYRGIRSDRPSSSKLAERPLRRTEAIMKPVSIIEALVRLGREQTRLAHRRQIHPERPAAVLINPTTSVSWLGLETALSATRSYVNRIVGWPGYGAWSWEQQWESLKQTLLTRR
jgi:hypothetical protein